MQCRRTYKPHSISKAKHKANGLESIGLDEKCHTYQQQMANG